MQRRLPEDDAFVVPHNLYLTMFSPSSVNVLAFDPTRGADHARAYVRCQLMETYLVTFFPSLAVFEWFDVVL